MMISAPKVPTNTDVTGHHNSPQCGWEDRVIRNGRSSSIRGTNGVPDAQASGFFVSKLEQFHLEVVPQ